MPTPSPHRTLVAVLSGSITASVAMLPLTAQEPAPPPLAALHSVPADPEFPDDGVWGSGLGYKVRLAADQVALTPYLGEAVATNRSLTWRTTALDAGGASLRAEATDPGHAVDRQRYEITRGPVTERWELRPEGVEQTFTLATRPTTSGDFVVRGQLSGTDLLPHSPEGSGHRAIRWLDADSGEAVLAYGAATLVDATGRTWPLDTAWHSEGDVLDVTLRAPAQLLAEARFPVTIDPLLAPQKGYDTAADARIVAFSVEPDTGDRLVVTQRTASASDLDLHAGIWRNTVIGGRPVLAQFEVLADVSTGFDSVEPSAVHVEGSNRFAIAFTRRNATSSRIRVFLCPDTASALGQGQLVFLGPFATNSLDSAAVASGTRSTGVTILVAAQADSPRSGGGTASTIQAVWIDTRSGSINRGPFVVAEQTGRFGENFSSPATLPVRDDEDDQFLIAYLQSFSTTGPAIWVRRQAFDGTLSAPAPIWQSTRPDLSRGGLQIAGGDGRYLLGWTDYTLSPPPLSAFEPTGCSIARFSYRDVDATVNNLDVVRFTSQDVNPRNPAQVPVLTDLDFDAASTSHWLAGIHVLGSTTTSPARVWRLGWDGQRADQESLAPSVGGNAWQTVTGPFVRRATGHRFRAAVQTFEDAPDPDRFSLWFQDYDPPAARIVPIGPGCGGGQLGGTTPWSGSYEFQLQLSQAPADQQGILLLALAAGQTPLDLLGAVGCVLDLDLASMSAESTGRIEAAGTATYDLRLASSVHGDLFAQWLVLDGRAPGGIALSTSARVEIR